MVVTVTLARGALRLAGLGVIVKRLRRDPRPRRHGHALHRQDRHAHRGEDPAGAPRRFRRDRMSDRSSASPISTARSRPASAVRSTTPSSRTASSMSAAGRKLDEVPFDFERRRVSVLLQETGTSERLLIVKGAPEDVLGMSTATRSVDGDVAAVRRGVARGLAERVRRARRGGLPRARRRLPRVGRRAATRRRRRRSRSHVRRLRRLSRPARKRAPPRRLRSSRAPASTVKILTGDNEQVDAPCLRRARHCRSRGVLTGDELASV